MIKIFKMGEPIPVNFTGECVDFSPITFAHTQTIMHFTQSYSESVSTFKATQEQDGKIRRYT